MPARDGTGPMGQGSMTGRRLGPCNQGASRGFFGRGFGFRRSSNVSSKNEIDKLKQENKELKEKIKNIEEKLK